MCLDSGTQQPLTVTIMLGMSTDAGRGWQGHTHPGLCLEGCLGRKQAPVHSQARASCQPWVLGMQTIWPWPPPGHGRYSCFHSVPGKAAGMEQN